MRLPRRLTVRVVLTHLLLPLMLLGIGLLRAFVYRPVVVTQSSMEPTLHENDRLLVNTWTLRTKLPPRGSVVVLQHPGATYWVVKRVVGVANDKVDFTRRGLLLNGHTVEEPYIRPWHGDNGLSIKVGPDQVCVAGDNRPSSEDSRDYGAVDHDRIVGQVVAVLWPPERRQWLKPAPGLQYAP
jgi:signal peptidase I